MKAINDININNSRFNLYTSDITEALVQIAKDDEVDIDIDTITTRRVGRLLGKLRFGKIRSNHKGLRQWVVTPSDLRRLAISYGLITPINELPDTPKVNAVNGLNGPNVSSADGYLQGTI